MTRIDYLLLLRLGSRIVATVIVVFSVIFLVESTNRWRFDQLASMGGPWLGVVGNLLYAAFWSLNVLPITVLIGAIIGLLDLRARSELTVISAAGMSIWRILRLPLLAIVVAGALLSLVGDTALISTMRALSVNLPMASSGGELWLQQRGDGHDYVLVSERPRPGGTVLERVTFFLPKEIGGPRIEAARAELVPGAWLISEGTRYAPDRGRERLADARVPTTSTGGDMGARLAAPQEMTLPELLRLGASEISDPALRTGLDMRTAKLLALPLVLAASLLVAVAFTTGYRRTNKYGAAVLYGIVLGFVFYVVTELAARAGYAGVLEPTFAAFAPALVALVVGITVLLFREDGRI